MITNRQKKFIAYFSSKALFLGVGYSLILETCANDSWICCILGSLLGIMFCYMIKKILDYKKTKSLTSIISEIPFLGILIRILLIIFSIIVINELLFILQIFAKSFFLINSTTFFIILPIILLAIYLGFKGYRLFSFVSECIFPIAIFFTLFAFCSLIFKVDYSNLKPILSHSNLDILKGTFYYFSISSTPLIFFLDTDLENTDISKIYIFTSIISIIITIILLGILGQFLITIYRFPEYMVLKNIQIFNFVEKIENIISISWIIDIFILLCFSSIFLKRMLPQKYNNYSFILIMFIIFMVVCTIFGTSYIKDLYIYLYLPYILSVIIIPVIIILFIHSIKKKKQN